MGLRLGRLVLVDSGVDGHRASEANAVIGKGVVAAAFGRAMYRME